ncbi:MAG: CGNR zinc finger domain-containing protein [Pseudomonadota bacterium]
MGYATGHPIRLVGGRLALDFVNTADWTAIGAIAHEKLTNIEDLRKWTEALTLNVELEADLHGLRSLRGALRDMLLGRGAPKTLAALNFGHLAEGIDLKQPQPLKALVSASAVSILADPRERARLKMCPGEACGWLFIDETKNSRRTWCSMESCGNRAKAARHYSRRKRASSPQKTT